MEGIDGRDELVEKSLRPASDMMIDLFGLIWVEFDCV
jgi:hypothetical protein